MRERVQAGFTLVEVMIATAIAAIGIVSLLELFSGSTRLVGVSAEQTEALIVARSIMDAALWQADVDESDQSSGSYGNYRWEIEVYELEPQLGQVEGEEQEPETLSEDFELKEIRVRVSWPTPSGDRSIQLETARVMESF